MSNTLNKPKVKDLIEKLMEFDPEMPVRIEDADTQWLIYIIHFSIYNGALLMSGEYHEMGEEDGRI